MTSIEMSRNSIKKQYSPSATDTSIYVTPTTPISHSPTIIANGRKNFDLNYRISIKTNNNKSKKNLKLLPPPPLPPHNSSTSTSSTSISLLKSSINGQKLQNSDDLTIKFDKTILSSNFLLRQFLRNSQTTAAINASTSTATNIKIPIYENLCTGCGYGVFDSIGNLCKFCQCIINGYFDDETSTTNSLISIATETPSISSSSKLINKSENIYENLCNKCGNFYNLNKCKKCDRDENEKFKQIKSIKQNRFFYGIFDTLKRSKSKNNCNKIEKTSNCNRKLEIIHNVDGFDKVYHTKEHFDLNQIVKLKNLNTKSNSDQHIYGKLRKNDSIKSESVKSITSRKHNSKSDTNLNNNCKQKTKTELILNKIHKCKHNNKNLRCDDDDDDNDDENFFIQENVVEWMTSLRQQTHNYYSNFMITDDDSICSIKSIPSIYNLNKRCSFMSTIPSTTSYSNITTMATNSTECSRSDNDGICNASNYVTNITNKSNNKNNQEMKIMRENDYCSGVSDSTSLSATTLCLPVDLNSQRKTTNLVNCNYSCGDDHENDEHGNDIKLNNNHLLLRQKLTTATTATTTATTSTDSLLHKNDLIIDTENYQMVEHFKRNIMEKQQQQQQQQQLQLQQQQIKLRSKRKAIYLKTDVADDDDDDHQLQFNRDTINNVNNKISLLNRRNRNGILCDTTNNSEFVNDLLNAFDSFLKRDSINEHHQQHHHQHQNNLIHNNDINNIQLIKTNYDQNNNPEIVKFNNNNNNNNNNKNVLINLKKLNFNQIEINQNNLKKFNFHNLIINLMLSKSLNKIIIFYDKNLLYFFQTIEINSKFFRKISITNLIEIYKKFLKKYENYLIKIINENKLIMVEPTTEKTKLLNNSNKNNKNEIKMVTATINKSLNKHRVVIQKKPSSTNVIKVTRPAPPPPPPPQPQQPPLPPPLPPIRSKTTKKTFHYTKELELKEKEEDVDVDVDEGAEEEEDIYQPIWKFHTIGNPNDENNTIVINSQLYENEEMSKNILNDTNDSLALLTSAAEDHSEWETDDEFMFSTTATANATTSTKTTHNFKSTLNKSASYVNLDNVSITSTSTLSTLTGVSGSGATALNFDNFNDNDDDALSKLNSSIQFKSPFRSICILYSPIELRIRAVLYDYDRNRLNHFYNLKNWPKVIKENRKWNKSGNEIASMSSNQEIASISTNDNYNDDDDHEIMASSGAAGGLELPKINVEIVDGNVCSSSNCKRKIYDGDDNHGNVIKSSSSIAASQSMFLPDCVQAWKFMLLDISCMEDEEDMLISENEFFQLKEIHPEDKILKLKDIELDTQSTRSPTTSSQIPIYKSASTDNLLNIASQDKLSIGEKFRNKLHRGVLKLNNKQLKDKKNQSITPIYRRSLYMDDSIIFKYPLFNAKLNEVQKSNNDPNVPIFVVDCINIIEKKESIEIDGLYRQSGNKTAIDDFKKKLTDNYSINSLLLNNEDIHTITGLLKLFFRELKTPLIPAELYEALPDNLVNSDSLQEIKRILNEIPEQPKDTLKYLLKHLTRVAQHSHENRMPISNLAIIWGPCILMSEITGPMDIARINTLVKILIEKYDVIYGDDERLIN